MYDSPLSRFIRNATPEEKVVVYEGALKKASDAQDEVLRKDRKWPDGDGVNPD